MLKPQQHSSRQEQQVTDTAEVETPRSEEIYIRNFDYNRDHHLTITVRDSEGLAFANRYYLTPGKTASELDRLSPGKYEIHVQLDGRRERSMECEITDSPAKTALIEVGNGTVSVTEGLYC